MIAGLVFTLVATPLGNYLCGGQTPGTGSVTPSTKKGITPVVTTNAKGGGGTPSTNAQGMPPAQTSCSTSGTARAFVSAPLLLGNDPNFVYIVTAGTLNMPVFPSLKSYGSMTSARIEIKT